MGITGELQYRKKLSKDEMPDLRVRIDTDYDQSGVGLRPSLLKNLSSGVMPIASQKFRCCS